MLSVLHSPLKTDRAVMCKINGSWEQDRLICFAFFSDTPRGTRAQLQGTINAACVHLLLRSHQREQLSFLLINEAPPYLKQ